MYFALSLVARNQLLQEGDELLAGMAADSLAQNHPRLRVEGGVERKRSMPDVLETVSLGPPGRQRQDRVPSIQGLDRRFLINTKHRSVLRWIHI